MKKNENASEILQKRGWSLYEPHQQKTRRRSSYERAVDNLNSNSQGQTAKSKRATEKPKQIFDKIIAVQRHLDARFAAKNGGTASVSYSLKQPVDWLYSKMRNQQPIYSKNDVQVITEQRMLTMQLLGDFYQSRTEIRKSYDLLDEYRHDTGKSLHKSTRTYLTLEKALAGLENDEAAINSRLSEITAESNNYAELVRATGNIRLERQQLVNQHEQAANEVKNSRTGLDEIVDYQMVIKESEHVLDDACAGLEQVSKQQAVAQAVLSAFAEGESSMHAAYNVVDALSKNIVATHRTITSAFEALNRLSTQLTGRKAAAETSGIASRGLYGKMRSTRATNSGDVHQYVKELFARPEAETIASNGHYSAESIQQTVEQ